MKEDLRIKNLGGGQDTPVNLNTSRAMAGRADSPPPQPLIGLEAVVDHFYRTLDPLSPNYFNFTLRMARAERNRYCRKEIIAREAANVSYGG